MIGLIRHGKFKVMGGSQIANYLIYTAGGVKKTTWCYFSALISEIIGTFVLVIFILASCERDNYLGPMLGLAFASVLISLIVSVFLNYEKFIYRKKARIIKCYWRKYFKLLS